MVSLGVGGGGGGELCDVWWDWCPPVRQGAHRSRCVLRCLVRCCGHRLPRVFVVAAVCDACGQTLPGTRDYPQCDTQAVTEALSRQCPVCKAQPGETCLNTIRIGQPLPGRDTHYARRDPG